MNWTISSLLDWTTLYFTKHGIESPHLEAEILLSHSLSLKRIDLYVQHERVLNEEELKAFKSLLLRRVRKEPTAYIIGYRPFMSLDLAVTKDVLIPRPETEQAVQAVLDNAKSVNKEKIEILDLGAGSGAIAVSIAYYLKNCRVTATDISDKAIQVAKSNAQKHGVSDRINFLAGDLFGPVKTGSPFDIIVSNPPYIPSAEIPKLQPEIKNYEPVSALDGGPDGMDFYRKILKDIDPFLADNGYLILEVAFDQATRISDLIKEKGIFEGPKIVKDHGDIDRVIIARRSNEKAEGRRKLNIIARLVI